MTYKLAIIRIIQILFTIIAITSLSILLLLKTQFVQNKIRNLLVSTIMQKVEGDITVSDIEFSFPLTVKFQEIGLTHNGSDSISIKNLKINILPSLLRPWKISLYSVFIDELQLHNLPVYKTVVDPQISNTNYSQASIYSVFIDHINIGRIILAPKITNMRDRVILSLDSNLELHFKNKRIEFATLGKIKTFGQGPLSNNLFNVSGFYNSGKSLLGINHIQVKSDIADISGNILMDMGQGQISGDLKYNTDSLNKLLSNKFEGVKSDISGNIKLSGLITKPEIDVSGNLVIDLPKNDYFQYFPLSWSSNLKIETEGVTGTIDLNQGEIKARGEIGYTNEKLYLKNLKAISDGFMKMVNIELDPSSLIVTGDVSVKDNGSKVLSKFFPFLNSGKIELQMKYSSSDNKKQDILLKGNISRLSTSFVTTGDATINIYMPDIWNRKLLESNLALKSLSLDHIAVNNLKCSSFVYLSKDQELIANISQMSGDMGSELFNNTSNIEIKYGKNIFVKIDQMKFGNGYITINADNIENELSASAIFKNISAGAFPALFTESFNSASMDGKIILSGQSDLPNLDMNLNITDILSYNERRVGVIIDSTIEKESTKIDMKIISDKSKNVAKLYIDLPSRFSLTPFAYDIDSSKSLNAHFAAKEKIDLLSLIPMPYGNQLEGYIQGDVKVAGSYSVPTISGNIDLSDGVYSNYQYGIKLKDISTKITASGDNITFKEIIAKDLFKKSIQGDADVKLNELKNFTAKLNAKNFHLITNPYLQSEINGDLFLKGDKNTATATGELFLGSMEIKIPDKLQQDIPELNIVKTIEESKYVIHKNKTHPYLLKLDIALEAENKIYVRGWGVDASLKGKLNISGDLNNPVINGALKSLRGEYRAFGKMLVVSEGTLNFDGGVMPRINIVGTPTEADTQINLILSGSLDNPDISIQSIPSMPQEEALSILLFGKNASNISTFQAVQLATAARKLSSHRGGFDPFGLGQKLIGFDNISFKKKADEDGNSSRSVGFGKYIINGVYLEFEQGVEETGAKTRLEAHVTPRISIENTVEQEGTSFAVYYKFDY